MDRPGYLSAKEDDQFGRAANADQRRSEILGNVSGKVCGWMGPAFRTDISAPINGRVALALKALVTVSGRPTISFSELIDPITDQLRPATIVADDIECLAVPAERDAFDVRQSTVAIA